MHPAVESTTDAFVEHVTRHWKKTRPQDFEAQSRLQLALVAKAKAKANAAVSKKITRAKDAAPSVDAVPETLRDARGSQEKQWRSSLAQPY